MDACDLCCYWGVLLKSMVVLQLGIMLTSVVASVTIKGHADICCLCCYLNPRYYPWARLPQILLVSVTQVALRILLYISG